MNIPDNITNVPSDLAKDLSLRIGQAHRALLPEISKLSNEQRTQLRLAISVTQYLIKLNEKLSDLSVDNEALPPAVFATGEETEPRINFVQRSRVFLKNELELSDEVIQGIFDQAKNSPIEHLEITESQFTELTECLVDLWQVIASIWLDSADIPRARLHEDEKSPSGAHETSAEQPESDPVSLTDEEFKDFKQALRAHHTEYAQSRQGAVVLRAFCACGYPDKPGPPACTALEKLLRG